MIPKIIHYCWFGHNPLPPLAKECIASWRKFLPDYEIWQWGEVPLCENTNETMRYENDCSTTIGDDYLSKNVNRLYDKRVFFDVNMIPYTAEAYQQGKYAFVSDYARFWIIYRHGGIYFDTDVEVIRPMDDIIEKGNFMGFEMDPDGENTPGRYAPKYAFDVAAGLGFGMGKSHPFMRRMLEIYENLEFQGAAMNPWLKTVVAYTTEALMNEGLRNTKGIQQIGDIIIYPSEYFAPINIVSGRLHVTENTRCIHRYMGSWSEKKGVKERIRELIPEWVFLLNNKLQRRRYKVQ